MNVSKPWCIELGFNLLWGNNISQQNTKQGFIISLNILNLQIDQENMIFHLVAINYYSKKKKATRSFALTLQVNKPFYFIYLGNRQLIFNVLGYLDNKFSCFTDIHAY